MSKVVNLNRFRKRKAKEDKERRAERNRRYHGRTKAEREQEEAARKRLEKRLDGAYLIRERVDVSAWSHENFEGDFLAAPEEQLQRLERATEQVASLSEYAARLTALSAASEAELAALASGSEGARWKSASDDEIDCLLGMVVLLASSGGDLLATEWDRVVDCIVELRDGAVELRDGAAELRDGAAERSRLRDSVEGWLKDVQEQERGPSHVVSRLRAGLEDSARRAAAFRWAFALARALGGKAALESADLASLIEQLQLEPELLREVIH